jgi:Kef-type K+ transport system membrane component KefB
MVHSLVWVALAAALAPLLSALMGRVVRIPVVVIEIVLGLLIGPALLGWVDDLTLISALASMGLALLFFMAGTEIDFARIKGRPLNRSIVGWLISLVGGLIAGLLIGPSVPAAVYIGIALSSTALGTLLPVLIDSGQLRRPFGIAVTAAGAVGEFGPLVAISIFLSARKPGAATVVLLAFVALAVGGIALAAAGKHHRVHGLITATLHTSGQFAVRLVIAIVAALVGLSILLGLDMLLGAFAAGVLVQFLLQSATPPDRAQVHSKLDAVAFGLLVPIFFINTGLTFDLDALVHDSTALVYLVVFLVLLLILRGLPGLLSAPVGATGVERRALVLMAATGLPIIVAVTAIGTEHGELPSAIAAALVGAGMLSVLLYPMLATLMLGRQDELAPDPSPAGESSIDPAGSEG